MLPSVRCHSFEEIKDRWEAVLPLCDSNTVFVTPWFQSVWWRHFGRGSELRIISLWDGKTLLGVAPLRQLGAELSFIGGTDLFDYHDFLVPEDHRSFYDALLDHLDSLEWETIDLESISEDSATLSVLPEVARERGYLVEIEEEDKAPVKLLPGSWDDYLSGLNKKQRHEIRRKKRRLESSGTFRQYRCNGIEDIRDGMVDFLRLLRASSPEKAGFMNPERESFFYDVAEELAPRKQFVLSFLEFNGVRVACCINFDYADTYFLYNSGYDPTYSQLSVGFLNKVFALKEAIEAGKSRFEFLRGTERYKYDLGATDRVVYRLVIRR